MYNLDGFYPPFGTACRPKRSYIRTLQFRLRALARSLSLQPTMVQSVDIKSLHSREGLVRLYTEYQCVSFSLTPAPVLRVPDEPRIALRKQ